MASNLMVPLTLGCPNRPYVVSKALRIVQTGNLYFGQNTHRTIKAQSGHLAAYSELNASSFGYGVHVFVTTPGKID